MIFEYNAQEVFTKQLEVADIGNACIRGTTDDLTEFYLITKTVMGKTSILKFGPTMPDACMLLDNFTVAYRKIDYKEATINREITSFINDVKKKITDVSEITEYEAFQELPNFVEAFNEL